MRRELLSLRHLAAVVVGAVILWITNEAGPTIFGFLPISPSWALHWAMEQGRAPVVVSILGAFLLSAAISIALEDRRIQGFRGPIVIGLGIGFVTFASRAVWMPADLYAMLGVLALTRMIGSAIAAFCIVRLK